MVPEDVRPSLAEMAITLAGCSGPIVSGGPGKPRHLAPDPLLRVAGAIVACLIATVCGVLPFALSSLAPGTALVGSAPVVLAGLSPLALVVVIVRAIARGTVRRSFPGVRWPSVAILAGPSLASVLSGAGLVVPFSPGILVRTLLASLNVSASTLVVAVARAVESDSPPAWQLGRKRGHATPD